VEKLKLICRPIAPAVLVLTLCACLLGISCRTNESPEGQVNDLEITAQIKAKLASDIGPSSVTNISVNSTNSVVTLSGQVDSASVKARAVTIAKETPKVTRVVDSLQITAKPQ
jgi:osmotically-inducible protein OsmY